MYKDRKKCNIVVEEKDNFSSPVFDAGSGSLFVV